jgi:hypothetical protein
MFSIFPCSFTNKCINRLREYTRPPPVHFLTAPGIWRVQTEQGPVYLLGCSAQRYNSTIPVDVVIFNLIYLGLSKRDELKGGWRKLHNEDLHNLYSSTNIIAMMKSEERDG